MNRPASEPLFINIAFRPVLLLAVLLVLGIAWLGLGSHFGTDDQFWHDHWWIQMVAGLGAGLLLFQVSLIAFLSDWLMILLSSSLSWAAFQTYGVI